MNCPDLSRLRFAPLVLALLVASPSGHAQHAVTATPAYPTHLNPALAVPAGTPVPDSAKLPAVPIPAPPSTLPQPGAALPLPPVAVATPLTPGRLEPAMLSWPGGVNPAHRAARTPGASVTAGAAVAPIVPTPAADGVPSATATPRPRRPRRPSAATPLPPRPAPP